METVTERGIAKFWVFSKLYKSIKYFWNSNKKEVLNSHRLRSSCNYKTVKNLIVLLRKHLQSFKTNLKRYPKMIIIGFLRRLALCMVGCFKQRHVSLAPHYVSLCMPTHKCSQCFNTGISRAESDLGSRHIFIWEISVPLTEWNCLRIKLSKYMKIIYGNCEVKNFMKEDHLQL